MKPIKEQYQEEQARYEQLRSSLEVDGKLLYVGRLLERAAQLSPDRVALIYQDESITYKQLYARACALAQVIKKHDVNAHDRVLICFENSPEFYVAYFAVWQTGAVVAPLNTFLKEVELTHIVGDAKPKLIITNRERVALFKQTGLDLPPILTEDDMPTQDVDPKECAQQTIDLPQDDLAALLYTSGTTGLPKGVMLSSRNILSNVLHGVTRLRTEQHDRVFGVLPLFHVFAQFVCVWGSVFKQATVILVSKIDRRQILKNLKHKPTIFIGVPALYGLLCLLRDAPLDSVDYFVSGGDALPDKIRMGFELLYRRKIISGYGLTETSPLVSVDLVDVNALTSAVGRPILGVEIAIKNEDGSMCAPGTIGLIWVKGDNVMLGYYNAPEMTQAVLKDGWFNTGDLGYIDEQGRLLITGRLKDLIIHKGLNIYPQEIENVIIGHPSVIRVGVIGRRDGEFGGEEVPVAFVQLRKQEENIEQQLRALCKQHLAAYKVPRSFICVTEELPTTATGKVDKKVLRKELQK